MVEVWMWGPFRVTALVVSYSGEALWHAAHFSNYCRFFKCFSSWLYSVTFRLTFFALSAFHYLKPGLSFSLFVLSPPSSHPSPVTCSAPTPTDSRWAHICHCKWPISHFSLFMNIPFPSLPSLATFPPPSLSPIVPSCCNKNSACSDQCEKPLSLTLPLSFSCLLSYLTLLVDTITEFNCQAALITTELSFFLSAHFVNDWAVLHKSPSEIHFRWFPHNPVISSLFSASLSCYSIIPGINGHPFSSTLGDGPSN